MKNDKKFNFITVPAALRELEKIEMIKGPDNEFRLDYAVNCDTDGKLERIWNDGLGYQDQSERAMRRTGLYRRGSFHNCLG